MDTKNVKIGVVGAGNMGAGIAQKYATEGFATVVVDVDQAAVDRGQARITQTLDEGVARKIFTPEKREQILARLTFSADKDALKGCALVVEAVFEDLGVKQALFRDLDARLGADTILGTNTSSFYVDDVAAVCSHPERVVGLHYFYHPAKNRLVEVIKGTKTSQAAFEAAWKIQEACGKTPVDSADRPGFIANRFFVPWLNESLRIVDEGVADIATVEAATKKDPAESGFGVGMGPFELMNVTGVPITLHAATTLGKELGAFYAPSEFIKPVVAAKQNWDLSGSADPSKFDVVNERLWGVVWQVAVQLVCVEKVCSIEDCDLGARVGLRWPKGPFEVMNDRGTRTALQAVRAIEARYADVKTPAVLVEHGEQNAPFAITLVGHRVDDDGVGTITFKRPDAMNALDEAVVAQLGTAFDALAADPKCKGIVIEGQGKAFVAGADVKFFVDALKRDDLPRILHFSTTAQQIFRRIDQSLKPVVCKLHGLSLGGGSELALACDWVVATPRGSMGFPETGIGIYPGLGGTQRTTRRLGVPLARWLLLTGDTVDAKTGQAAGLIDDVVDAAVLDAVCRARALSGETRAETMPPTTVPAGFEAVARAFTWTSLHDLLKGLANGGAALDKSLKKVAFKAPLACQVADDLVKLAATTTLEEGLAHETAQLSRVFSSNDAFEGLSTLGVRRPTFRGV